MPSTSWKIHFYVILALVLSSCTSTQDRSDPFFAADNVGNIPEEKVIGTWQTAPLDRNTESIKSRTVLEYHADGTLTGIITSSDLDLPDKPALTLRLAGQWHVDGAWLRHTKVTLQATGDDSYARQYNQVLNASSKDFGSTTNVLELDEKRMITISEDGRSTLYIRQ